MGADIETRNLSLKEISRPVAKGAQAAVLMARAPGHTSGEVKGPKTLTLIFLPARSPGLNRVENVWQSLRENGLSNRLLEDQADGLAAGCDGLDPAHERTNGNQIRRISRVDPKQANLRPVSIMTTAICAI